MKHVLICFGPREAKMTIVSYTLNIEYSGFVLENFGAKKQLSTAFIMGPGMYMKVGRKVEENI